MKKTYIAITICCLMLSFPMIFNQAKAQTGTLYVDPSLVKDVPIGSTFTVDIKVANIQNLYTWQIKLLFNATVLECTGATYPPDHVFAGQPTVPVTPIIDNTAGYVLYGCSLMGAATPFSGSGKLCQITFQVKALGESDLKFSTPYGQDTYLLDYDLNSIDVTVQNGFFTNLPTPSHDVAVTSLSLSNSFPKQGATVTIDVTVLNNGSVTETFDVNLYYDSNLIATQTVNLAAGDSSVLTFSWDTTSVPLGSYTIKAEAEAVPGETKLDNNVKTAPVMVISPVAPSTDINGDGKVDMQDIGLAARAFGESPGRPRWDPRMDINGDGVIDLRDLVLIAKDFGKMF
ncbi:MAG: cohesin domain-containing protein [Candidatus Bathyarchaeia archaeon]